MEAEMDFMQMAALVEQLIPVLFQAMGTVQADTGKSWEQVAVDVINHLTPGKPGAPALSETAPLIAGPPLNLNHPDPTTGAA
jgi:hypothetical protein